MNKEQVLAMLRRMRDALNSNTNRAIINNIIRELENDQATVALAIHEARVELQGSDADRDDEGIEDALDILRAAVAAASNRSANNPINKKERDLIIDSEGISFEINDLKKRKEKIKQLALNHRSQLNGDDLNKYNAELQTKLDEIDAQLETKYEERNNINSLILKKEGNPKMKITNQSTLTKSERAMAAGLAIAKLEMARRSKGKIQHRLTEDEAREILRYNKIENLEKFSGMNLRADVKYPFETLTTTSEDFVAATVDTLGINNAGIFIPVETLYDLLQIKPRQSAFFQRVRKINIAAKIDYPYSEGNSGADWYEESDCTDDESIKFATLELGANTLAKFIKTTFEMEAMTPASFLTYLLNEIRNEMDKALNISVLYGRGKYHTVTEQGGTKTRKRPQPYGVAFQNPDDIMQRGVSSKKKLIGTGRDYPTVLDAMEKMPLDLLALNRDALDGAEYFMSFAAFQELWNMKDSNGDRMFDIARPITFFGNFNITIDMELRGKDIIFGNPANYVLNTVAPIRLYNDSTIRCRQNMYGAFGMFDGMGFPNSFIFASDSETPRDSLPADTAEFRQKINYRGKNA